MKKHFHCLIFASIFMLGIIEAPLAQDPCLSIATIDAGVTNSFSLATGAGTLNINCSGSNEEGKEIIYQYTATTTGIHAIDILSNNNTVPLALMYKDFILGCNSTGWICITGGFTYTPSYYITLSSGTTYYFMFDRTNGTSGTLNSSFKITAPGTADPCTAITNVPSCGVTMNGSMGNGLGFINTQCFSRNDYGEETIFSFTPTMTGLHAMDILTNNNGDVLLLAYKNAIGGCNSTGWTCVAEFNYAPSYYLDLKKDTTYYFLFDKRRDNPTNTESFSFRITCPGTADPCTAIMNIPSGGVTMNGSMGSGLGFINTQCLGGNEYGEEAIFSFTPTMTGLHAMDILTNNNGDVLLLAYKNAMSGCTSTGWTCVAEFNYTPSYYLNLKKDTTYYFLFDKRRDNPTNSESFSFRITCPGTADPCTAITNIPSCGVTMNGSMGSGLGYINTQCFGGNEYGEEVIFSFTATMTGLHAFDMLTNNNGDVLLLAFKNALGGCNSTGWTCVAEFNYTPSYYLDLKKDTTYYFLFDKRRDNPSNSISFSFRITCPGTIDPCTVITNIPSCGVTMNGSLGSGLGFINTHCFGGNEYGEEMIFSFTPTMTGLHALDMLTNNNGDVLLLAFKNAVSGCNSAGWSCIGEFNYSPSYYLNLKKDTTYYFLFDKWRDNPTNTELFSFMITCPGTLDPCTVITPVTSCSEVYDVTLGTGLGFINTQCFGGNEYGKEAIFSFTAAQTGTYSLDMLSNNNGDVLLFARKDASSGCNSSGWTCVQEFHYTQSFSFSLTADSTYYFLFDNRRDYPTGNPSFSFKISCPATGDPCLDILSVPECGSSFNISLGTGTGAIDANCSGANEQGKEQLFSFTPGTTGPHAIGVTSNNNGDALSLSFKEASAGCNNTGWSCLSNGFTGTPEYLVTLTGGTEYYFLFDRLYNNTTSTETFTAKFICQGTTDPCTAIKPLTCSVTETDTISGNLGFLNASCSGSDEEGEEKIYSFTPTTTGVHTIDFQSNNNADGMGILYKEAGIGCNNTGWTCISNNFTGTGNLNVTLTTGVSYLIMFDREFTSQASDEIYSFILVCPGPAVFNVTGGGSYCPGGTGLTVGLDGSETEAEYQLKKDNIPYGSVLPGTGSPLSWNDLPAGTYTIDATNVGGTAAMNGSAIISNYPVTIPAIKGPASVCEITSTENTYTTESGMTSYLWTVSSGGVITSGAGTDSITVTWNNYGHQTVSVNFTNTYGCRGENPTIYDVTVNPLSVGGSATGGSSIILGQSTGSLILLGNTGEVLKWQKKDIGISYRDIPDSDSITEFSEIPESIGYWSYRAIVQSSPCDPDTSSPTIVNVIGTPSMTTSSADDITATTAVLYGMGKMNGAPATTTFEYGLTESFGTIVPGNPPEITGDTVTLVTANISGLLPDTNYYFRVTGTNVAGTTNGNNMVFKTDITNRRLTIWAFIEGLYETGAGAMKKAQDCLNGEITFDKFAGSITDTVSVKLANETEPWDIVYESHGLEIQPDGKIRLLVPVAFAGNYYIVINHRQSVETWSAEPVSFNTNPISYNFTYPVSQAYGNNMKEIAGGSGICALFGGEITGATGDQDGYVDIFDNVDVFNNSQSGAYGYIVEDVTGDGFVDIFDMVIVFNNMQNGAGMNTPPNPVKKGRD